MDLGFSLQALVLYMWLLAASPSACSLLCSSFGLSPSLTFMLFWSSRSFALGWPGLEHRLGAQGEGAGSTAVETGGGSRWWGGDFVVGGKGRGKEKLEGSRGRRDGVE